MSSCHLRNLGWLALLSASCALPDLNTDLGVRGEAGQDAGEAGVAGETGRAGSSGEDEQAGAQNRGGRAQGGGAGEAGEVNPGGGGRAGAGGTVARGGSPVRGGNAGESGIPADGGTVERGGAASAGESGVSADGGTVERGGAPNAGESGTALVGGNAPVAGEAGSAGVAGGPTVGECQDGDQRFCRDGGLFGPCADGTQDCSPEGRWGACSIAPADADTCEPENDANCSGTANDGCPCVVGALRPCSEGGLQGACANGQQECLDGPEWGDCDIPPADADTCEPGNDANCNGTPNEGCNCDDGDTQDCGSTTDTGECRIGTSTCRNGSWGECEGSILPVTRDCASSADNDCDGSSDNTPDEACQCPVGDTQPCRTHPGQDGTGICHAGSQTCVAAANGTSNWGSCSDWQDPTDEGCTPNETDEDCDGTVDNPPSTRCECVPGESGPCGGHAQDGVGICHAGTHLCNGSINDLTSSWGDCTDSQGPAPAELCNNDGLDEDCDELVNEDPPCACINGQQRCFIAPNIHRLEHCVDGAWATEQNCTDQVCYNLQCTGVCRPPAGQCVGNDWYVCQNDGQFPETPTEACGSDDMICRDGEGCQDNNPYAVGHNSDLGTEVALTENILYFFRLPPVPQDANLQALALRALASTHPGYARFALYSEVGGKPSQRLVVSNGDTGVTTGAVEQWTLYDGQYSLVAGTRYWLAIVVDATPVAPDNHIHISGLSSVGSTVYRLGLTYGSAFPDPFPASGYTTWLNLEFSVYAIVLDTPPS